MNGIELEQIKEVMRLHIGYLRIDIKEHGETLNEMRRDMTDTKVEVAKLQVIGVRRASWVSAVVSGAVTGIINGFAWLLRSV